MRFAAAVVIALGCFPVAGQVPASAPSPEPATIPAAPTPQPATSALPPQIKDTNIGFSYSLPADWQAEILPMAAPDVPYPTVVGPKKGNACAQVELTARQGKPYSVVVVIGLPFDCYGQTLTSKNMADLATGATEGLKQTFDVTDAVQSTYTLGTHSVWLERASGTVKGQSEAKYTLEIVCTVLSKGEACWLAMAADAAHLATFEQQPVSLEGDSFDALVPAGALPAATPATAKPS